LPAPPVAAAAPGPDWGRRTEVLRGKGEVVLVVDVEESVRAISRQTLEAFGYRVETAVDGADALAIYAQHGAAIDVVLTDMVMPVMDGAALIRALLRLDPGVRIIAASGLGVGGGTGRAAEPGAGHFLSKPYTAETLLRTVRQALDAV
jgi:CheY-like chemotaxis protein